MLQVNHKISIGSASFQSGAPRSGSRKDRTRLVDLRTSASLNIPTNTCRLVLSPPDALNLAPEDPVTVELGYEDKLSKIFTGTVDTVEWNLDRVTIHATSSFQKLLAASFNLLYEKSKAGDIVSDVVGRLGLSSGKVESGIEFPVYVLGDSCSVYEHLRTLGRQCGFDLYADPEDRVVFATYSPAQTHQFEYGANILALAAEAPTAPITGVEIYGESPTSFGQGADAYAWLTKQEVQGKAGDASGVVKRVADPTARTLEAASQIATVVLAAEVPKRRGSLKALGTPEVKLGDAIEIAKMPIASQNGSFKVIEIRQSLNRQQGFCSLIQWEER